MRDKIVAHAANQSIEVDAGQHQLGRIWELCAARGARGSYKKCDAHTEKELLVELDRKKLGVAARWKKLGMVDRRKKPRGAAGQKKFVHNSVGEVCISSAGTEGHRGGAREMCNRKPLELVGERQKDEASAERENAKAAVLDGTSGNVDRRRKCEVAAVLLQP